MGLNNISPTMLGIVAAIGVLCEVRCVNTPPIFAVFSKNARHGLKNGTTSCYLLGFEAVGKKRTNCIYRGLKCAYVRQGGVATSGIDASWLVAPAALPPCQQP